MKKSYCFKIDLEIEVNELVEGKGEAKSIRCLQTILDHLHKDKDDLLKMIKTSIYSAFFPDSIWDESEAGELLFKGSKEKAMIEIARKLKGDSSKFLLELFDPQFEGVSDEVSYDENHKLLFEQFSDIDIVNLEVDEIRDEDKKESLPSL